MKKIITKNLKEEGIRIVDDKYISKKDYEKIIARMGDFLQIKTVKDAKNTHEEIRDHLSEVMVLLKSLKDAIPEQGSGTAYHAAMR